MKAPASAVLTIAIALAGRELPAAAVDGGDAALAFLNAKFSLGHSELKDVRQYRPLSRTFDTSDDREVATLGILRIRVPPAFYVEQMRQITDFKRNDAVLQLGTFGSPAQLEDVRGLTLEPSDVDAASELSPWRLRSQLSSEAIRRFQQQTARLGSGNASAIDSPMREVLVDLVNGYRDAGDGALMTYVDSGRPLSIGEDPTTAVSPRRLAKATGIREPAGVPEICAALCLGTWWVSRRRFIRLVAWNLSPFVLPTFNRSLFHGPGVAIARGGY